MATRLQDSPYEREILKELSTSLSQWGFGWFQKEKHLEFRKKVLESAETHYQNAFSHAHVVEKRAQELTQAGSLPRDRTLAVKRILETELQAEARGKFHTYVIDLVDMDEAFPFTATNQRRSHFSKIRLKELDPFERFEINPRKSRIDNWREDPVSLDVMVFKALVSLYMETSMACYNCKSHGCLKWSGGVGDSVIPWSDALCVECLSTYVIKTKADDDDLNQCLEKNVLFRSSFRPFFMYAPHGNAKRYAVISSRSDLSRRQLQNQRGYRVAIGEIDKVLPRLSPISFVLEHAPLSARFTLKAQTIDKAWFYLPHFKEDHFRLAREVHADVFSDATPGNQENDETTTSLGSYRHDRVDQPVVLRISVRLGVSFVAQWNK